MLKVQIGDLIRHKHTRESFLVVDKTTQGLLVVNLMLKVDPALVLMILPRTEQNFEPDTEMIDMTKDEADTIIRQLDLIEAVEDNG